VANASGIEWSLLTQIRLSRSCCREHRLCVSRRHQPCRRSLGLSPARTSAPVASAEPRFIAALVSSTAYANGIKRRNMKDAPVPFSWRASASARRSAMYGLTQDTPSPMVRRAIIPPLMGSLVAITSVTRDARHGQRRAQNALHRARPRHVGSRSEFWRSTQVLDGDESVVG
jgi:hypothetical protein